MVKKIIHIQVQPKLSGAQQISYDILKNLGEEYQKTIVFGGEDDLSIKKIFNDINVEVIFIKSLRREIGFHDIKAFINLYKLFKDNKYDIVHTNSTKPGVVARIAARFASARLIVHTVHGIAFHKFEKPFKRYLYYLAELFATAFGDLNVSVNRYYLKFYPKFLSRSVNVYNGVDFSSLKYDVDLRSRADLKVIGFFARLDDQKDPLFFIDIANHLIINKLISDDVIFKIAGDGPLKENCTHRIAQLGIADRVLMVGWITDKNQFLNSIDVLCQPSLWEAFGLNLVEAAYCGLPCVASNVEGIPEVIIDGETGILCEPKSLSDFSNAVVSIINDKEFFMKLSENAHNHVKSTFTVNHMVNGYVRCYSLEINR